MCTYFSYYVFYLVLYYILFNALLYDYVIVFVGPRPSSHLLQNLVTVGEFLLDILDNQSSLHYYYLHYIIIIFLL